MKRFLLPVLAVTAFGLTSCISLLPKTDPVQMYRFGFDAGLVESALAQQQGVPVSLSLGPVVFPPGSAGDGIMTVENNEVAYVEKARWAAGARELFTEAVQAGYARSGGNVRLDPRGRSAAAYRLDIAVRGFETRYVRGKPVVSVALDARITRQSDRTVVASKYITREAPVRRNDMSLTVESYNQAVTEAVGDLIGFSQATLSPMAPPPTPLTEMPKDGKQKVEGL
ncbi:hypothetical protein ABI_41300 [Asticcacaulis biprosthecium C19]|uniref:ABC-type transport auxiliary lipoprotein component domain-containing protein n=1 Tax=Asticcacaulis biprosthecium C19 TaxID=715226 RepID=F4QSI7_9CAUL|nr:ABC-type transport auxiliary lipoprotein family protein [Asticcacaulis biprosthecium]EGF89707.1 hypothetical protein ABI_41300 [Asticcacaulis biprosthecium C19]